MVERLMGRKLEDGANEEIKCMKVSLDPVVSVHRPFLWYSVSPQLFTRVLGLCSWRLFADRSDCRLIHVGVPHTHWLAAPFDIELVLLLPAPLHQPLLSVLCSLGHFLLAPATSVKHKASCAIPAWHRREHPSICGNRITADDFVDRLVAVRVFPCGIHSSLSRRRDHCRGEPADQHAHLSALADPR